MARNLRRALKDSKTAATANLYGFTFDEAKDFEKILMMQDKKKEIEEVKKLLEKNGRYIERIENAIPSQNSIIIELERELGKINNKLTISRNKTQKSKNLINTKYEELIEEHFIESSKMSDLEHKLKKLIEENEKNEKKLISLMAELETLQKGGKKRVVKRKARSAIRRKPTAVRRRM